MEHRLPPLLVVLPLVLALSVPAVRAIELPEQAARPDFDARLPADPADRGGFALREPTALQLALAAELRQEAPGVALRWDGMSGAPKWIAAPPGGTLSPPADGAPEERARAFLRSRAALLGITPRDVDELSATGVVPSPDGGSHVYFTQRAAGLEVIGGRAHVNLRPDGSVRSLGSSLYEDVQAPALPIVRPDEALRLALQDVYPDRPLSAAVDSSEAAGQRLTVFDGEGFARQPTVRLAVLPLSRGAGLVWEVRVAERSLATDYRVLVDALDGRIVRRRNVTLYADARVLLASAPDPQSEEANPAQYGRVILPSGWISPPGTSLAGNNATSHLEYWDGPGLTDPAAVYDHPFNTTRAALVNAWYWVNEAHDLFYGIGFDEAAGNYQNDNFGQGGVGGDAMRVVHWTHGERSTAFYTPSVDGGMSTLNFAWGQCIFCGDHDGYPENGGDRSSGLMRVVVVHEYTHGVTVRRVGGPADDTCLSGIQSGAMGEGWSDLFPASFWGDPRTGDYFYEGSGWLRSVEQDVTYADYCAVGDYGCIVHHDGMIWGGALWDLRRSMIADDPAGGLDAFHRIVIEGLASTACRPTMIDARDGILDADTTLFGSAHHTLIWNAFAARGMGLAASSTSDMDTSPVADFSVPPGHVCSPPTAPTLGSAAPDGNNAVRLQYTSPGAAAIEVWRESLDNPHDRPILVGLTDDPTTWVDDAVQGGRTYRYSLIAHGAGGVSCRSAASNTADATATGECEAFPVFDPDLSVTDGAADCSVSLSWSAASPGCPAAPEPIVYDIYGADLPGFEPSDKTLLGRTGATSFDIVPPETGKATFFLVLAQHGTTNDAPDHRDRGSAQVLQWLAAMSTTGRTAVQSWDFDTGAQGWSAQNFLDPSGAWTLVDPASTTYAGSLLAPDQPAGGSGLAWVTGDAGGPSATVTERDCDGRNFLYSPFFNGTNGATIFSFDYWSHLNGRFNGGIELQVSNGVQSATIHEIGLMTAQRFETEGRHGWQRYEIDLSQHVAPSPTMRVRFTGLNDQLLSEFGIDNVRLERASLCSRANLEIASATVDDSPPAWGNGNGLPEPGETVHLLIDVVNSGSDTAVAPTGELIGLPAATVLHEPTDGFPDVPAGQMRSSSGAGFTVTLPDAADCDEAITFTVRLADANGTTSTDEVTFEYGNAVTETVFQDDLETDPGSSWIVSGAGAGHGVWEWGDPVGTLDGATPANPEDCADGPGTSCFVTENGAPAADPNLTDVDSEIAYLDSPAFDLTSYKRARVSFDHWYHESTATEVWQDYSQYGAFVDDGGLQQYLLQTQDDSTGGWVPQTLDLTTSIPSIAGVRLRFLAHDRDASGDPDWADHLVESGVDNVLVEADRQVCDPSGVNPPNGVGATLVVDKSGADVPVSWTTSPTDPTHDPAVYYRLYVSASPAAGFSVEASTMGTSVTRTSAGGDEYLLVSAVNAGGSSGDDPAP